MYELDTDLSLKNTVSVRHEVIIAARGLAEKLHSCQSQNYGLKAINDLRKCLHIDIKDIY